MVMQAAAKSTQAFEMLKCCALKVTDMDHEQAYFIVDGNELRDKDKER